MLAIETSSFGPPSVLRAVEIPQPEIGPGEVLIRVEAAGVSRADILQRQGNYPPPPGASQTLGLDVAGSIAAVGSDVVRWRLGDRVCALVNGGGYAEFCSVPFGQVLPIPEGWSATEAATLPENLFTVFDNMVTRAGLRKGDTVLVHGGTSGIGSMAIMLARAIGAVPYATAGSDEKCEACLRIGAERAINYRSQDFVVEIGRYTGGRGVDVVLDIVGGSYLEKNLDALAIEGRLSIVATLGGSNGAFPIRKLMGKRATVLGSTMRVRTTAEKAAISEALLAGIWPLLPEKKSVRPVIDSTFPLQDARAAHERMESGLHIGKIVLTHETP
jgi:NADPH2:quinone reductase